MANPRGAIYYVSPEGKISRLMDNMAFPNGIALSQDEKTLYIGETMRNAIWSVQLEGPGELLVRRARISTYLNGGIGPDAAVEVGRDTGTTHQELPRPFQLHAPYGVSHGLPDVEGLLILGEGDAVRKGHVVHQPADFPLRGDVIDGPTGIGHACAPGIGEVQAALAVEDQVVRRPRRIFLVRPIPGVTGRPTISETTASSLGE